MPSGGVVDGAAVVAGVVGGADVGDVVAGSALVVGGVSGR